jgi:hypothetical protein
MKTSHPVTELEIPSTQKKIQVRPLTGKDEKLLLMAKQSGEIKEILNSIKQVVNNCIVDEKFDIDSIAIFDLEWLFLQLWAISAENVIKVSYNDGEDNKDYDFEINIHDIKVEFPEGISSKIVIDNSSYVKLKWPSVKFYTDTSLIGASNIEIEDEMIYRHIDSIVLTKDGKETIVRPTKVEATEFIDNVPLKVKKAIRDFMDSDPSMKYTIAYTNTKGTDRVINLSSLADFFIFV